MRGGAVACGRFRPPEAPGYGEALSRRLPPTAARAGFDCAGARSSGLLSGPNPGYGFGVSPTPEPSHEQHVANIRGFLAQIDPATGYIGDA